MCEAFVLTSKVSQLGVGIAHLRVEVREDCLHFGVRGNQTLQAIVGILDFLLVHFGVFLLKLELTFLVLNLCFELEVEGGNFLELFAHGFELLVGFFALLARCFELLLDFD